MNKTQKLTVRFTDSEFKKIRKRSASCRLTKSAYVRLLVAGYKPRESPPADYFAMKRELCEIGNNLNQLAFVANATGLIDEATYYENVIMLRDALQRIEKAVTSNFPDEDRE